MIHIGVDLHQRFCYMTALEARGKIVQSGPVTNEKQALRRYFRQFRGKEVQVAVEACGFWPAFREVVEPEVERLVHPQRVKAIASAKLKNDRVDSETLAHLLRCDCCRSRGRRIGRRRRGGSRCGCGPRWCGRGRG
jgi:transposase